MSESEYKIINGNKNVKMLKIGFFWEQPIFIK